jgi:integrase
MASIRKRGDSFTITAYMGYDEKGRQIKKTTTYHPPEGVTPGKAEKLARQYAEIWDDKVKGFTSLDENRTFADLSKWYFENVAPFQLKPNVLISQKNIIDTYVMPRLARKKLKEIGPVMLDTMFTEIMKGGRTKDTYILKEGVHLPKGKKNSVNIVKISQDTGLSRHTLERAENGHGIERTSAETIANYLNVPFKEMFESNIEDRSLSVNSVSRIRRCLSAVFTAAVKKEIMRRNPVSNTVAISRSTAATSYLDEKGALHLLEELDKQDDFQFKVMIYTLLFTGMRGGECCGLQWSDIDFESNTIHVCHTLSYIRNVGEKRGQKAGKKNTRHFELQTPKTENSDRYIVIPSPLLPLLKEHKERQEQDIAAHGDNWNENNMVFITVNGNYFSEGFLNHKFKKFALKIGLPENIHLHSLRHTTASLLINQHVPAKMVADQLGHATPAITEHIYAHLFEASRAKTAKALEFALTPNGAGDSQDGDK